MRSETPYQALRACIDLMRRGVSDDECVRLYPQYAEQLQPLLRHPALDVVRLVPQEVTR